MPRHSRLRQYQELHAGQPDSHFVDLLNNDNDARAPGPPTGNQAPPKRPRYDPDAWCTWASELDPQPLSWLWPGRIPFGKLTILDGDPGLGKSTLLLDLAARFTSGRPMPDGTLPTPLPAPPSHANGAGASSPILPAPGRVILLSAEDGLADTILPRLAAAGADLRRILLLNRLPPGYPAGPFTIPNHLPELARLVRQLNARLVILDPLIAYLAAGLAASDQGVRRALHPLAYLAERSGAAFVAVRHPTKRGGRNPIHRGGGSIGLIGAARSGLIVAADPDDPTATRRVLASVKLNLGPPPPSLAYRLVSAKTGAATIHWEGPTHHQAADLFLPAARPEQVYALSEAKSLLRSLLVDGPLPARQVLVQALAAGISRGSLQRAKVALGVRSQKLGGPQPADQPWLWSLPAEPRH